MKLSVHVCEVPCPEEYYMGASVSYKAYTIEIPDKCVPKDVQDIVNGKKTSRICNIAFHYNGEE